MLKSSIDFKPNLSGTQHMVQVETFLFVGILVFMSSWNFMKSFITSGPDLSVLIICKGYQQMTKVIIYISGWRGFDCSDGKESRETSQQLLELLLLTLSNALFIPGIILALYRRHFVEALVYAYTMTFSGVSLDIYYNSKTCVKWPLKKRQNKGLNDNW